MKKGITRNLVIAAIAGMACLVSVGASAQFRARFQPPDIDEMAEALGLSADQKEKAAKLFEPPEQDRSAMRRGNADRSRRPRPGRRNINAELEQILTADQMKKYRDYMANRAVDMRMRMFDDLNLTADQQNKIRAVIVDENDRTAKMRDEMQDMDPDDRRALFQKFRGIREETDGKIMGILNADQKKTYQEMQERMRENMRNRRGNN